MNRRTILAAALLAASMGAQAQSISITTLGGSVGTDFNTLPTAGSFTILAGQPLNGVYALRTGTGATLVADAGTTAGGNNYSYGTGTATDRALGSVGSGNAAAGNFFYGVRFSNNTGSTITSLTVGYVGEQWRNGGNTTANVLPFSYVTGAPVGTNLAAFQAAGTNVAALDFSSPINTATAAALDGNAAANRVALSSTITGLTLPNGSEIMLRWSDPDHAGTDHGMAIDDVVVVAAGCLPAQVVSNTNDSGAGSLRDAMAQVCNGGTVTFNPAVFAAPQTITLTSGQLTTPATPVTITGPGSALLTVSGNNASRVFHFLDQVSALSGVTITQGNGTGSASLFGGGLRSRGGSIALDDVRIVGNTCSPGGTGGGLSVTLGTLDMVNSEVSGNSCPNNSGIYLQDQSFAIRDSLIANNVGGDAIRVGANFVDSVLTLRNSTITGHATTGTAMAVRIEGAAGRIGTANITSSTISGNSSTDAQGALGAFGAATARFVLSNTVLVGNTAAGTPSDSTAVIDPASSFNVIGAGGGLVNGSNNNQVGVTAAQAALGVLGNYAGPTRTLPLLPGSVAINAGTDVATPPLDQRGIARPAGAYDVGAYESRGFTQAISSGNNQSTLVNTAFATPLAVQLTANATIEPVAGGRVTFVPPGAGQSAALAPPIATANASGIASTTATANGTTGAYTVAANANGVTGSPTFSLTNLPGGSATTLQFSAATYSVAENGTTATITVTATTPPTAPITINYATSDGTALAGSDYTAASGTLSFGAGVASQTFIVTITDDGVFEPGETINLSLSTPTGGATLGTPASAVLTIVDNDVATSLQFSAATYSVSENGASATITVTATPAPGAAVAVSYATSNGTATAGVDYLTASGTLNFGVGVASQTFTVPIIDDALNEANSTVNLALSTPTGGAILGAPSTAVLTIVDNDPPALQFSAATYSVSENGASATITVTATPSPAAAVAVSYATSNGTATAGTDYTAASGTLTFGVGVTTQTFTVPITDDAINEASETVNLALSTPTGGATLGTPNTAVLTIVDNDPPSLQFSAATYSVSENGASATITVTATPAPAAAVTVSYATSNGTATAGSDYTAATGTLTFGVGVTTQTFTLPVTNDSTVEGNETVNLALSNPTGGAALGTPAAAVLTITNDDSTAVTVSSPTVAEGNAGTTPMAFQVSLSNPVQGAITLDYASADGNNANALLNATVADNDYQAATGTVSFPSGTVAAQTVNVLVVGDTEVEPDQQLRLALSNLQIPPGLSAASINVSNASGTGTISNDDGATLSVSSPSQAEGNAAGQLAFVVTLSAASKTPVTVNYATGDGTATAGADYTATSATLTFAPGAALTQTVNVAISGDVTVEPNETLTLTLANPVGATLATATGTGTLNNDDSATLSLDSVSVAEGNTGTTPLTFTATLSAPVQGTVTATVNSADGNNADPNLNATVADNDYVAVVNSTVSITTGATTTTAVQVVGDQQVEPNQGLVLTLSNLQLPSGIPAGAITLGTATGNGTINNDDLGTLSVADASAPEGSFSSTAQLRFAVTLSAPAGVPVSVDYATTGNTATPGTDFTTATGTLTFAPGSTSQFVEVTLAPDMLSEPDETLTLTLSNPQPSGQITLARASATGTITNDDFVTQIPALGVRGLLGLLLITGGLGLMAVSRRQL